VSSAAAVVLAAGEASRYGAPKQRLLLPEVLARLAATPVTEVVVVAGAYPLELPSNTLLQGTAARLVSCPEWRRGPGASLRCGLAALGPEIGVAVVVLADGPDLAPEAIDRVLSAQRESGAPAVAASYAGERGHPLALARSAWDDVPNAGLRVRDPRLVPCDDLGSPGDVDTPADLPERLRSG
jgi:CTP:molybdopterin cytidylyltransferase MocA